MDQFKHIFPLPRDDRDFSHDVLVGSIPASKLPAQDFDIAENNPIILNQKGLDFCTAFASSEDYTVFKFPDPSLVNYLNSKNLPSSLAYRAQLAVTFGVCKTASDYLASAASSANANINSKVLTALRLSRGDYFDPLYQFSKTKQIRGEFNQYGANVRDVMLSFVKYGALMKSQSPFTYDEGKPTDKDRNFIADWNNWPQTLDALAAQRKAPSFFSVTGQNDTFDNIRSVLWQNKQTGLKSGVIFGTYWKADWGTIIPNDGLSPEVNATGAHCVWIRGQKTIGGVIYLVVQNSYGAGAGDNGLFYFPREVINRNVPIFGAFYFSTVPAGEAQFHQENGIKLSGNWLMKMISSLTNFFIELAKSFKIHG